MQEALIQRYLGNKTPIASHIVSTMTELLPAGGRVFDAFSGSMAVSAALRESGFNVASNDINHFSWALTRAFFTSPTLPKMTAPIKVTGSNDEERWQAAVDRLVSPYSDDIPIGSRRSDFFDYYCEEGAKSAFTSKRGQSGNRRFFSSENARAIDRALSRLRYWHTSKKLCELNRCIFIASLLSAVEKVSNTQGTYHDFPRNNYDPRSLKFIKMLGPKNSFFKKPTVAHFGKEEDTLSFVDTLPKVDAIYLDPPYNFRQYTSYYFLLNLISSYVEIDDLDYYFENVQFVRGQNMKNDFKSTFCSKPKFLPSLGELVDKADTKFVILSYFDGRNHWGEFKSATAELEGIDAIRAFFESSLFVPGSSRCAPITRQNYQSYGGHNAKQIQEFLFVAEKSNHGSRLVSEPQNEFGLESVGSRRSGAQMA